jgi:hypothetical protein
MDDALINALAAAVHSGRTVDAFIGPQMGIRPFPPARPEAVAEAERTIGFRLPELLRRIYVEVGNGGFGPGYGLLGVSGGATDDLGQNALDQWDYAHRILPSVIALKAPASYSHLFPCIYGGCTVYLCVDCHDPAGSVWSFDPGNGDSWEDIFSPIGRSFFELMREWVQRKWADG